MMKWLTQLNPDEPLYIGSVAYVASFTFGHGGSGYVVSQAAMSQLFKDRTGVANRWDKRVTQECCGDLFAPALHTDTGVAVQNAWPAITGERPHTIPHAENEWCQSIVTMHHVGAQEDSDLFDFENMRNFTYPMRIRDLFHGFVEDLLVPRRDDWDNLSDDVFYLNRSASTYSEWELSRAKQGDLTELEADAHRSFDDCRGACQSLENCLQYRFWNGICSFGCTIKLGKPAKGVSERWWSYKSGWDMEKIQKWVRTHDRCGDIVFPRISSA